MKRGDANVLLSWLSCSIEIGKLFLSVRLGATDTRLTALYGKPYIPAAKDTWNLLRKRGIDALVNDSLVGLVLTTGAYIVGRECLPKGTTLRYADEAMWCSVDGIVRVPLRKSISPANPQIGLTRRPQLRYTSPAYNASGQYTAPVILFGALIGLNVGLAVSSAIVCPSQPPHNIHHAHLLVCLGRRREHHLRRARRRSIHPARTKPRALCCESVAKWKGLQLIWDCTGNSTSVPPGDSASRRCIGR